MAIDLFKEINNALLDLQAATYQTFQRPLKRFALLLQHPDLAESNKELTEGQDLDAFLASQESRGGMVGSDVVNWPEDQKQSLGLMLLLIFRFADKPDLMVDFGHTYYDSGLKLTAAIHGTTRQLLIPFVRDYKAYVTNRGEVEPRLTVPGSNKVFIVHGHDEGALQSLARFLEKLQLEAVILKEQPNQGQTIIEKYEQVASDVALAVVLLTPDDLGSAKASAKQGDRARQNVIFELGYFAGRLGRGRVCLLRKGDVEIPSDLFGVLYIELDAADGWKTQLLRELKAAKLEFDANRMW